MHKEDDWRRRAIDLSAQIRQQKALWLMGLIFSLLMALLTATFPWRAGSGPETGGQAASKGPNSGLEWSGDFEGGSLSRWSDLISAAPDRITTVPAPGNRKMEAVRLTAWDDDGNGANPRAQLNGPLLHHEGSDQYISFSVLFPDDFPPMVARNGGKPWFVFFEWHGPPFRDTPLPGVFDVMTDSSGASTIGFSRDEQYGWDRPWSAPLIKGIWQDFLVHVKFSKNPRAGLVELWHNGVQQRWANGSKTIRQSTIKSDQNEGLFPIATNYRAKGMIPGPVTVYFGPVRVGQTLESVKG